MLSETCFVPQLRGKLKNDKNHNATSQKAMPLAKSETNLASKCLKIVTIYNARTKQENASPCQNPPKTLKKDWVTFNDSCTTAQVKNWIRP